MADAFFATGQNTDIDTSAEQVDAVFTHCNKAMVVKADDDNSGSVYIGVVGVTTATGFRLKPGQGYKIDINNSVESSLKNTDIYAIGSAVDQVVGYSYQ